MCRKSAQHELRERIGYVPQKGYLFTGTIASNLRYAKEGADEQEMRDASRDGAGSGVHRRQAGRL